MPEDAGAPRRIDDLPTPALLVDVDRLERNLREMSERCAGLGVRLRPHVKTHKCVEIAERQRALGPPGPSDARDGEAGITVSTLEEARVFAEHGFGDMTWAFPVIPGRLEEAAAIARRATLRLVIDSAEALAAVEATGHPFHVWLQVDCGYHRVGVDPEGDLALDLARALASSERLTFDGLLTHGGHAYHARSRDEAARVAEQERAVTVALAERLRGAGVEVPGVSVGSTPGMSAVRRLDGVTEARPGNYAYYDFTQVAIGSCTPRQCALTVLSTVVSCQPGARHAVCDAGALALSNDPGPSRDARGNPTTWGEIYADHDAGILDPDLRLASLSQEHGILSAAAPVGTRLRILPNHSCLTNACFDRVHAVSGDRVVGVWTVHRGR
jgi:D-serine deaminase-like pyridoxal phosphate-dependent protein